MHGVQPASARHRTTPQKFRLFSDAIELKGPLAKITKVIDTHRAGLFKLSTPFRLLDESLIASHLSGGGRVPKQKQQKTLVNPKGRVEVGCPNKSNKKTLVNPKGRVDSERPT